MLGSALLGDSGDILGGGTTNKSSRLYKALVETELASDVDCAVSSTVDPFTFSFEATVRDFCQVNGHAVLASRRDDDRRVTILIRVGGAT
mgnify:CR=1 FL=1